MRMAIKVVLLCLAGCESPAARHDRLINELRVDYEKLATQTNSINGCECSKHPQQDNKAIAEALNLHLAYWKIRDAKLETERKLAEARHRERHREVLAAYEHCKKNPCITKSYTTYSIPSETRLQPIRDPKTHKRELDKSKSSSPEKSVLRKEQ